MAEHFISGTLINPTFSLKQYIAAQRRFREKCNETIAAVEEDAEFEIIKSKKFAMHPMSVEEAILQMNLLNHDFFVFFDTEVDGVSVVYRRKDGKYGLLTPELK